MIKENQKHLNRAVVFLDIVSIVFALVLSWYLRFESGLIYSYDLVYIKLNSYLFPVVFIIPIYLILYGAFKLYTPYRFKTIYQEAIDILKANVIGILIFIMLLYLFKEVHYSRYLLLIFSILCTLITIIERIIIRYILHRIRIKGYNQKHILVIGYNMLTIEFINRINKNYQWGYNVLAILDEDNSHECKIISEEIEKKYKIGDLKELDYYLDNFVVDEIFITLSVKYYNKLEEIIRLCEKSGIRTQIIPDYYRYIPAKPYVEELDGLPVINIRYIPLDNILNKIMKRVLDIVVSLMAIVIFSPIMLCAALIIKITSPGNIIFKQERVGKNRKNFNMYKFRSMKIQEDEDEVTQWTTANDTRKTWFGNFMRKSSIDELPQIFNVLKGDMSLIGPRPERPFFVEKFKEEVPKYMIKHQVRPGMTGWAQVNGWRGDTSIKKRIEFDIYYIENWSFWFDIKIMWLTVFKGFVNRNAY